MTGCTNHPDTLAMASCQVCQRPLCAACIKQDGMQIFCIADYDARDPLRVKVEPYRGTVQPLPPPMPQQAKLATIPDAELPSAPSRQETSLADDAEIFLKQLGSAGVVGAASAVFGIWFGNQLINENGHTGVATSDWSLGLLMTIALLGIVSSCLALRQRRTSDRVPVALLSVFANLLIVVGIVVAFVIFHSH